MALYLEEFPDYDGSFYCPKGFADHSYHNDTMPRALHSVVTETMQIDYSIWQDYIDVRKREYDNQPRYCFQIHVNDALIFNYQTDDILALERLVSGVV